MRGFVLFVTENGKDVSGGLCSIDGDTMFCHRGGVLDGNEEHVRNGAQSALYLHRMHYAKDRQLRKLDLGHSRAFFRDGVYSYKRGWGASVSVDEDIEFWMYLFNPKNSVKAVAMLQQNPLIVHTVDGLIGNCICEKNDGYSESDINGLVHRKYALGLKGIRISSQTSKESSIISFEGIAH
ncbi:MAG: hypothetical protein WA210_07985 [Burkholderiaceae bacterium]